ncbi:hypothetical protein EV702DRAFT_470852 [Suillus placidus]|uniref:Uncharacterized protein n=1 Tax=Suillus placidus TaxID=48579 RepID=A0A9P7D1A0_9AGAM|nr:hypothetical protein EV702DRAFT_470852 [Suillus placidus]
MIFDSQVDSSYVTVSHRRKAYGTPATVVKGWPANRRGRLLIISMLHHAVANFDLSSDHHHLDGECYCNLKIRTTPGPGNGADSRQRPKVNRSSRRLGIEMLDASLMRNLGDVSNIQFVGGTSVTVGKARVVRMKLESFLEVYSLRFLFKSNYDRRPSRITAAVFCRTSWFSQTTPGSFASSGSSQLKAELAALLLGFGSFTAYCP